MPTLEVTVLQEAILLFFAQWNQSHIYIYTLVEYNLGLSKGDRNGEVTLLMR